MKNLVVIKADQLRFDALGCMGNSMVKTPNIDSLASESFVFENAFCVSPLCVPSRVAFFTGQYPHKTACTGNGMECHISSEQFSFIPLLKEAGYTLGLAGKNHAFQDDLFDDYFDCREEYSHHKKTHGKISESDKAVELYRSHDKRENAKRSLLGGLIEEAEPFSEEQCMTHRIVEDGIEFIDKYKENPFFLHLSFPDPHWPNVACEPYFSMYDPKDVELEALEINWENHPFAHYVQSQALGFADYTQDEIKKILAVYYGQISFIDKEIGKLLKHLDEKNLRDDTIIVFTSDHGDFGGRYGIIEKTKAFYEPLLRVPLIIHLPGNEKKSRISAQVSNIDVMPTLFDVMGIETPSVVQGKSFLEILDNPSGVFRNEVFAELGSLKNPPPPMPFDAYKSYAQKRSEEEGLFWFIDYTVNGRAAMIRKDDWKYCYYTGDKEELYDLKNDPLELRNLAYEKNNQEEFNKLKNRLMEWLLKETVCV
jgi:arylsulfatase A-like enzyme